MAPPGGMGGSPGHQRDSAGWVGMAVDVALRTAGVVVAVRRGMGSIRFRLRDLGSDGLGKVSGPGPLGLWEERSPRGS